MCITWIFATFIPLDEAHNEEDQDEKSDGAHQSNKPALSGDVHLAVGYSWTHREGGDTGGDTGDEHTCQSQFKSRGCKHRNGILKRVNMR